MTASTVKSVNITNMEAAPRTYLDKMKGIKQVMVDKIAVATTSIDEIGDIILCGVVPSNAKVTSIKIFNDDLDSNVSPALAADVGLYYTGKGSQAVGGKSSGTVVSATCIGTAITTLQAANVSGTEVRFEADDIVDLTKEAWEVAGLSADCGGEFYIGFKVTTAAATAAAGDLVVQVEYFL